MDGVKMNNWNFIKSFAELCRMRLDSLPNMSAEEKEIRKTGIDFVKEMAAACSNTKKQEIYVVAALIWDNGRFMICQRPENKASALQWEFVGGKVEVGETWGQALVRECEEELGVTVSVGSFFAESFCEYTDCFIRLVVLNADIKSGTVQKLEHKDIRWITPDEIPNYTFSPATQGILRKIKEDFRQGSGDMIG